MVPLIQSCEADKDSGYCVGICLFWHNVMIADKLISFLNHCSRNQASCHK